MQAGTVVGESSASRGSGVTYALVAGNGDSGNEFFEDRWESACDSPAARRTDAVRLKLSESEGFGRHSIRVLELTDQRRGRERKLKLQHF